MSHIFISYHHGDADFAEVLSRRLVDVGYETWLDMDKLAGGDPWRENIDQAIKESLALVVVMTPEAKASEYVT